MRHIANMARLAVVPPGHGVVRHAKHDAVAQHRGGEARCNQAMQIVKAQPTGEHAAVFGLGERRANANASRFNAVAVKVQARQVFAKGFAQAIHAVRAWRCVAGDRFVLPVKTSDMVGAGKHNALDTVHTSRLIQVVHTQDVGLQNRAKRAFDRHAAQMNNRIGALHHGVHGGAVGQVSMQHFFTLARCTQIFPVGQTKNCAVGLQSFAQRLAQPASCSREQQSVM